MLDWLQYTENLTYAQTLIRLRDLAGSSSSLPSSASPSAASSLPLVRQTLTDLDDDGQALLYQVTDWYHHNLLQSPDALA